VAQALVAASEAVALAAGHPDLYIQAATTARDLGSPLGGWLSQARAGSRADVPAMCMGSSPRPVLGPHWCHRCGLAPRSRISITIRQQAGRAPAFNRRGASHFIIERAWRLPMQVCRLAAPTPCMLRPGLRQGASCCLFRCSPVLWSTCTRLLPRARLDAFAVG